MFTRPFPWLPSFTLCLLFASPILSDHPPLPPTTQYDPFHAIAALAPKPSEVPICRLKPLTPLEPVDDDLFLSFEDWKAKRFSENGSNNNQKSNGPPNASTPTRGPAEGGAEAAAAHTSSISFDSAPGHVPDAMDATPSEGSVGGSTTPIPPPAVSASPHFLVPLTDRFNYASLDCSARVHTAHGAAKSAASILSSQRDRYMLSPCGAKPQFVVVELCEDIRIDTVQLANFEFFSGVFKEFTVSVAKTYAAADAEGWTVVGTYVGKNVRGVQSFHPPTSIRDFYRYIRIDFHTHYSNEYYCPISLLRVYGLTHLEQWKWDTWEEESRARLDLNAQAATAHVDIPHEPERPAETPQQTEQTEEEPAMSHDSSSPATPSRDSTTDLQGQRSESSRPPEGQDGHFRHTTNIVRSEPSTSSPISSINSDSPIISTPSSASSDSVQAVYNSAQQSHMFMSNDFNTTSITTASSSSVFISSHSANVLGTTISTSRSSQSIVTPVSSPSVIIHASASHSPPPQINLPLSPSPVNVHSGESIYRTIMNRLSALEANTTLHARYVEEQTSAMREMLRRLSEDVGRLEGIGRAQAQMYARSISDFEKHRREIDIEQHTLITQVNYLAEEIVMEKRLGIAQLCLLLAVLVFLSVTRGSPGEFHIPRSNSNGSAVDTSRIWGRPSLRRLSGDWVSHSRLRSASSGPPRSASQDSQSHTSTPMASTPVSRAWRWPAPSSAFLSPPPSSSTTNTTGPGGHFTKKAMAMMTTSLSTTPTPTPTFRQKRPPPLYLTPSQHQPYRAPRSHSTHAQVRTRPNAGGGGDASPTAMRSLPKPIPVQRSSSYGGSFVGGGTTAVPRSARRWARSAHLHEVRRARHHHHHHHHNHNHHGVNVSGADSTGVGKSESADDVFAAAPSRGSRIQSSAPVAGSFGTDDALLRMWMRNRTRTRLGDERGDGDGDDDDDDDDDEGGAETDTWVDTDTDADVEASTGTGTDADADADADGAYGLWPGPGEVDAD
ncbi:UNC-like C-terminal-domain-containing protein [Russula emetica]|nr:UNC-like C-terminal-domain-containing protein [Russula emetica]